MCHEFVSVFAKVWSRSIGLPLNNCSSLTHTKTAANMVPPAASDSTQAQDPAPKQIEETKWRHAYRPF